MLRKGFLMIERTNSDNKIDSFTPELMLVAINSNLEEYRILIEEVSSTFYENLNARFPNLTPNERKICVYLRLNMSSHEISQFTQQSDEALKKARFRLRQKLGIKRGENLVAFLQQI